MMVERVDVFADNVRDTGLGRRREHANPYGKACQAHAPCIPLRSCKRPWRAFDGHVGWDGTPAEDLPLRP
jgi:hypothetical protein